jgi:hypothetical protein
MARESPRRIKPEGTCEAAKRTTNEEVVARRFLSFRWARKPEQDGLTPALNPERERIAAFPCAAVGDCPDDQTGRGGDIWFMKTKPFFFSLPWMAAFGLVALECVSLMLGPGEERMKDEL